MNLHRNARTTPISRAEMARRVLGGQPPMAVATAMGEWRCSNTRRTISPRLAGVVRAFLCKFIRSPENR